MKYFIGIDLSLTGTGIVLIDSEGKITKQNLIETSPKTKIELRIAEIASAIHDVIHPGDALCMEGLAFGARGQSMLELAGLHYHIRITLTERELPFRVIPPTTLKKFITGKGNAKKEQMLLQVYKRFGIEFDNNNLADAYGLARMAMENKD
jgi:crossover junction endodeoxyribonuclease RuvC